MNSKAVVLIIALTGSNAAMAIDSNCTRVWAGGIYSSEYYPVHTVDWSAEEQVLNNRLDMSPVRAAGQGLCADQRLTFRRQPPVQAAPPLVWRGSVALCWFSPMRIVFDAGEGKGVYTFYLSKLRPWQQGFAREGDSPFSGISRSSRIFFDIPS